MIIVIILNPLLVNYLVAQTAIFCSMGNPAPSRLRRKSGDYAARSAFHLGAGVFTVLLWIVL